MNDKTITFAKLRVKLKELGFVQYEVSANGKQGYLFEKEVEPTASLYLADYKDNELVAPFDLHSIWMTLKSRGIIEEKNPLLVD